MIIDTLKNKYSLPILLERLVFSKSSYYYQKAAIWKTDKYETLCSKIRIQFHENKQCYGYRRIYVLLKRKDIIVSEKVIRRIMQEENLIVNNNSRKKYAGKSAQDLIPCWLILCWIKQYPGSQQRNDHSSTVTEAAIIAGQARLNVWKKQVWSVPCLRRAVLQIMLPVKDYLAAKKMRCFTITIGQAFRSQNSLTCWMNVWYGITQRELNYHLKIWALGSTGRVSWWLYDQSRIISPDSTIFPNVSNELQSTLLRGERLFTPWLQRKPARFQSTLPRGERPQF